ncbi:HlyD family secretion protein [candidate division KSB1 bacterium]
MPPRTFTLTAIVLSLFSLTLGCGQSDTASRGGRDAGVVPAIIETGELEAVHSTTVYMPWVHWDYGRPQITGLATEGLQVRKGDMVGELDVSGVVKVMEGKKTELAMTEADLNKMIADHKSELQNLQSELQSALAALKSAEIDTQRVEYESEMRQDIARMQLRKAIISLDKLRGRIESRLRLQQEDLKIQQAKITQIHLDIETAGRTMERYTLRAPADGLVVYGRNRSTRTKINVGDQIWPGNPLISLPDLSQLKVLTTLNEVDIQKVRLGQKVKVRLDAYPKIEFDGAVSKLSKVCRRKERDSNIKVFDLEVLIEQTHKVLKPGMTVNCEFIPTSRVS